MKHEHDERNLLGAEANPPVQLFARTAEYYSRSTVNLFAVVFDEFPVRVHLKSRLFTVRLDEHLVTPLTIGIVFP